MLYKMIQGQILHMFTILYISKPSDQNHRIYNYDTKPVYANLAQLYLQLLNLISYANQVMNRT